MGKLLALDIGERRIGLAVTSEGSHLVFPRDVIDTKTSDPANQIIDIIQKEQVALLIAGLPLNHDGTESGQCQSVRSFVKKIQQKLPIEVFFINEYATSKEALQRFKHFNADKKLKKGVIDSTAAVIILETYLNYVR